MRRLHLELLALIGVGTAALCLTSCGEATSPTEPDATLADSTPDVLQLSTTAKGGVPSTGNDNKFVGYWEDTWVVDCGGPQITGSYAGWGQFKLFGPPNNRHVELGVFHLVFTYTNSAGDTWVWRDVGPDRSYINEDGDLIVTITGRSTASGTPDRDEIVVGHVVLNETTGVVEFIAGRQLGGVDELACSMLT